MSLLSLQSPVLVPLQAGLGVWSVDPLPIPTLTTRQNVTEEKERTPSRHLGRLGEVAMLQVTRMSIIPYINNVETIADSRGDRKRTPWAKSSWLISVLRTQGSTQVRAATAQVQRRKRILVGWIVVWDFEGILLVENVAGRILEAFPIRSQTKATFIERPKTRTSHCIFFLPIKTHKQPAVQDCSGVFLHMELEWR